MDKTIKSIIKEWLIKNKYGGLCIPGECGCSLEDLFACGSERIDGCQPAGPSQCIGAREALKDLKEFIQEEVCVKDYNTED